MLHTFVALCLGALVGLERQVAQEESGGEKDFPGVRTFAFTALLGALAVLVSRELGPWLGVALFAAISTFLVLRYRYDAATRDDPGYTTEIASLCTFAVGVLAQSDKLLLATVVTIAMVALLRSKRVLHRAGELLSPVDMEALIRFLVITGIVLPLLPDDPIDPFYEVLRPRDVWRMVVLISGVSFAGYVLMRLRAGRSSQLVMGLLGGFVSSTAAALAYTRAARAAADSRPFESLVVLAASTSFLRIGLMLAVAGPDLLPAVAPVLVVMSATSFALAVLRHRPEASGETHDFGNPLTMRFAFGFAAVYAVVLLVVAAARDKLGLAALYATSAVAGLMGADAPSLSLARLSGDGVLDPAVAASGIVGVALAATLGKVGIVAIGARGAFPLRVGGSLLLTLAAGAAVFFWLRF
ncbi:MAG: MgtC/SapB family protein [Deltaproteobacteria bacterium]|nr:MgtC/SapB family protein [Deltaproteobacteria bacterium]MBW2413926.1 MgtC/SapB family protein [Deltaproteobacteria bacterium]